jgi:hypothetical protein
MDGYYSVLLFIIFSNIIANFAYYLKSLEKMNSGKFHEFICVKLYNLEFKWGIFLKINGSLAL